MDHLKRASEHTQEERKAFIIQQKNEIDQSKTEITQKRSSDKAPLTRNSHAN